MKLPAFDRNLGRTVLFSVAVVLLIIGIHRTIVENDLPGNYTFFALSAGCLLIYRSLHRPEPEAPAPPAKPAADRKALGKGRKRR